MDIETELVVRVGFSGSCGIWGGGLDEGDELEACVLIIEWWG